LKSIRIHNHGSSDVLTVDELDDPVVSKKKIKIKIEACSMNHLDIWVRNGLPGLTMKLPLTLGSDAAGTVVEMGKGVKGFSCGDKVVIQPGIFNNSSGDLIKGKENLSKTYGILGETENGVQSSFAVLSEENICKMPIHLNFIEASSMQLVFMTAYQMLVTRAELQPSNNVLIYGGSSGIGSAAIQIAKDVGSYVIATAGNKEKEKHSYEMGADAVVMHYNNPKFVEQVKSLTKNKLCNVVFEHVGFNTWDKSMKCLSRGGRIVTCGATSGANVQIDLRYLFMKQQSVIGSTMANIPSFNSVMSKINKKIYFPFVDKVFSFNDVKYAHNYMEQSNQKGKIVLVPS